MPPPKAPPPPVAAQWTAAVASRFESYQEASEEVYPKAAVKKARPPRPAAKGGGRQAGAAAAAGGAGGGPQPGGAAAASSGQAGLSAVVEPTAFDLAQAMLREERLQDVASWKGSAGLAAPGRQPETTPQDNLHSRLVNAVATSFTPQRHALTILGRPICVRL